MVYRGLASLKLRMRISTMGYIMKNKNALIIAVLLLGIFPGLVAAQWRMSGHDAARTGYIAESYGTGNSVAWQTPFNPSLVDIVAGGDYVFVRVSRSGGGEVVAQNVADGAVRWNVSIPGGNKANLIFSNGRLLVAHDDGVTCLDVDNGQSQWEITDDCEEGILLDADYLLLVDSYALRMYSLSSREKLWEETFSTDVFRSEVAVAQNKVFFYHVTKLFAYEASGGTEIYEKTGLPVSSSRLVYSNGNLYVGTSEGEMQCYQASTGDLSWSFETDGKKEGQFLPEAYTPAVGNGKIVFAALDYKLYCLTDSGTLSWKTAGIDSSSENQLAMTTNLVYLVDTTRDQLRCFSTDTGTQIWAIKNELNALPTGNPILTQGKVLGVTTSKQSKAYSYAISTGGQPSATSTPTPSGSATASPSQPASSGTPTPSGTTDTGGSGNLLIYIIIAVVAIVAVVAGVLFIRKRGSKAPKQVSPTAYPPPPPPPS
jgi:outer membrane protein assembly factor BamB